MMAHSYIAMILTPTQSEMGLRRVMLPALPQTLYADNREVLLFMECTDYTACTSFSGVQQGCVVAPDLFLTPMDWLLNHTDQHVPRAPLCLWLGTMLKSSSRSHILVSITITLGPVSTISGNAL